MIELKREKLRAKKAIQDFFSLWFIEEESAKGIGRIVEVCETFDQAQKSLEHLHLQNLQSPSEQGPNQKNIGTSFYLNRENDPAFHLPLFRILSAKETLENYSSESLIEWL